MPIIVDSYSESNYNSYYESYSGLLVLASQSYW
jgi:hypothetical protein